MPTADVDTTATIEVQVVFAEPDQAFVRVLTLAQGSTVGEAVAASGWPDLAAGRVVAADSLGIFGQRVAPQQVLRDGDRVEIYRPLQIDPMAARRRRAQGD